MFRETVLRLRKYTNAIELAVRPAAMAGYSKEKHVKCHRNSRRTHGGASDIPTTRDSPNPGALALAQSRQPLLHLFIGCRGWSAWSDSSIEDPQALISPLALYGMTASYQLSWAVARPPCLLFLAGNAQPRQCAGYDWNRPTIPRQHSVGLISSSIMDV
jgi:hypothetical protein